MTTQSESIADLVAALAMVQGEIRNPAADKIVNVQGLKGSYSYRYTDLAGTLDVIRGALSKHGLAVIQTGSGTPEKPTLRTTLAHKSGQWIAGEMALGDVSKLKAQDLGSLLTYLRRYSLSAIVGIAQEDDDARSVQEAQHKDDRRQERRQTPLQQPPRPAPKPNGNGNGHAEPARPPAKSECREWFEKLISDTNHEWSAILGDENRDKEYKDVANIYECCNHLVKDWIAKGMLTKEAVTTNGKWDNAKVWRNIKAAWAGDIVATRGEARDYAHGRLVAAALAAGINLDAEPQPAEAPADA
jgi:hypothetical protein